MWRGVSDANYLLIPKVAREWHLGAARLKVIEEHLLNEFKFRGIPYLTTRPANDWEWLAQAQHYGLPTRLLDWTRNPLIALYFACTENFENDGAVYFAARLNEVEFHETPSPFQISEIRAWSAMQIDVRLKAQDALFTIAPDPTVPIEKGLRLRAVIKASAKKKLREQLNQFGVHIGSIFPGLEGVAKYVESKCFFGRGIKDEKVMLDFAKKILEEKNKETSCNRQIIYFPMQNWLKIESSKSSVVFRACRSFLLFHIWRRSQNQNIKGILCEC